MRYTRPRRSRLSHSPRVMTLFAKPTLNNDRIHECALSLQSIEHRARATRYTRHACWSDNCAPHSEINDFIYARISHQAKTSCIVQRAKGNIYIYTYWARAMHWLALCAAHTMQQRAAHYTRIVQPFRTRLARIDIILHICIAATTTTARVCSQHLPTFLNGH